MLDVLAWKIKRIKICSTRSTVYRSVWWVDAGRIEFEFIMFLLFFFCAIIKYMETFGAILVERINYDIEFHCRLSRSFMNYKANAAQIIKSMICWFLMCGQLIVSFLICKIYSRFLLCKRVNESDGEKERDREKEWERKNNCSLLISSTKYTHTHSTPYIVS